MFSTLPDSARLWLFVAAPPDAATGALAALREWLPSWASHGRPVTAAADSLNGGILAIAAVISADELNAGVSGCGIDAMQQAVTAALGAAGGRLSPGLAVRYRGDGDQWVDVSRPAFRRLVAAGEVHPRTLVVDATPTTLRDLRGAAGAVRPAADAWTGRAFGLTDPTASVPSASH